MKSNLLTLIVLLISTAPDGHFRGGKRITNEPTEVDLFSLSEAQLDAIHSDKQIIRPQDWADKYAEAKARFGLSQPQDSNAQVVKLRAVLADREEELRDRIAVEALLRDQLAVANARIAQLEGTPDQTESKSKAK